MLNDQPAPTTESCRYALLSYVSPTPGAIPSRPEALSSKIPVDYLQLELPGVSRICFSALALPPRSGALAGAESSGKENVCSPSLSTEPAANSTDGLPIAITAINSVTIMRESTLRINLPTLTPHLLAIPTPALKNN